MSIITKNEIDQFLKKYPNVEYVNCIVVDMLGIPRGKQINVEKIYDLLLPKLTLPKSILLQNSKGLNFNIPPINPIDPDYFAHGIANTLHPCLWSISKDPLRDVDELELKKKIIKNLDTSKITQAQVMLCLNDEGNNPFIYSGRELVKKMEKLIKDEFNLTVTLAIELEFYLYAMDYHKNDKTLKEKTHLSPFQLMEPLNHLFRYPYFSKTQGSCYGVDSLESISPLTDLLMDSLKLQNVNVEGISSEYGEGQFEVNLKYNQDPVKTCDETILLKNSLKAVAKQFGAMATFMAVPNVNSPNGMHINISLQDQEGNNVFVNSKNDNLDISDTCLHVIAGLQRAMGDSMLVYAPNLNSYKRYYAQAYGPSNSVSWGINNRTVAIRIPAINKIDESYKKSMRIEHRVAGADSNPYLATAAALMGAYIGLKEKALPTKEEKSNNYDIPLWESMPPNMALSLSDWSKKDNLCRKYFGQEFCDVFYQQRISEWYDFMGTLTQKDFDWYFYY